MCRWLAYSGAPVLIKDVLYEGPNSLVHQSLSSRLGAEPTNGDGFGVGWYGDPDTPGLFHSTEPAWNDQQPARARRPHQLAAVLHPYPRGDRQRGPADQLPPLPARPLAVHAQRLPQRVRHRQARPDACRRPVAVPGDQGPGRHGAAVLPRPDLRPPGRPSRGRRAGDRARRGGRRAARSPEPVPGHGRDHRRRDDLGVPLLQRTQVAHAVLHHRRPHAAQDVPRARAAPGALRQTRG